MAIEDNDSVQIFRTQVERVSLIAKYGEGRILKSIRTLDSLRKISSPPYSNIFCLLISNYLSRYETQNNTPLRFRSFTGSTDLNEMETWDPTSFRIMATYYYRKSLENLDRAFSFDVAAFDFMLDESPSFRYFRPTLYDMFVQIHLNSVFYNSASDSLTREWVVENFDLLSSPDLFIDMDFSFSEAENLKLDFF